MRLNPTLPIHQLILLTASHGQIVQKTKKIPRVTSLARITTTTINFNNREFGVLFFKKTWV